MELRPTDRRGLGEILAWSSVLICLTAYGIVVAIVGGIHGNVTISHELLGMIGGCVAALSARGFQSAAERSGSSEALNTAANELRKITEEHRAAILALRQATPLAPAPAPSAETPPSAVPPSAPVPLSTESGAHE